MRRIKAMEVSKGNLLFLPSTLLFLALLRLCTAAAIIRVPEDQPTIHDAVTLAQDGDTVIVGPGDWVIEAPITPWGKAIKIKSAQGPQLTTIAMSEPPAVLGRGCVMLFESGEGPNTVIDGFTIMNGYGFERKGQEGFWGGGAIACFRGSSPTIRNCIIKLNSAVYGQWGGGVLCVDSSSPHIEGCSFLDNLADRGGAIACLQNSSPVIERCFILGNACRFQAAAILCSDSSPTVVNCVIAGNRGRTDVQAQGPNAAPSFINCTFFQNGVSCTNQANPLIKNCLIWPHRTFCGRFEDNFTGLYPIFVRVGDYSGSIGSLPGGPQRARLIKDPGDYHLRPYSPAIDLSLIHI